MVTDALPGQERDEFGWVHVLLVLVVGDEEHEASNYLPVEVRFSSTGNFQIRSNQPRSFKVTRAGFARLAFMNGDFVRLISVPVAAVQVGNRVEVLQ